MGMMLVVQYFDTRVVETIYRINIRVQLKLRQWERLTTNLLLGLINVITVKMTVPSSPYELPWLKITNLSNHACQ